MDNKLYDVIVIGTGIAGVSAALTLSLRSKTLLWLGSPSLSEKTRKAEKIKNYPGLADVSGETLAKAMCEQIAQAGLAVTPQIATGVYAMGDKFTVTTETDMYESRSVILATGVNAAKSVAGEDKFLGRGVSYCATCDGTLYKGKTVAVICSSKEKEAEAEYLASLVGKMYFIPRYKEVSFHGKNVEEMRDIPEKLEGNERVEKVVFKNGTLHVDGVFFFTDSTPPAVLVGGLKTENGHVVVARDASTNIRGLFAAGDCTGMPYQYAKAAGEGNVAALSATEYLRKLSEKERAGATV